ncbi:uncharacterized protein LOC125231124 [Leguminivora glycinivorella]|uniref:uncharacterized protein LOC125231124 n=1 Tax=Leguminivora glycinivorella TaxID=1035111 RepID=UPI00200F7CB4|nr:uncharacterized protein LOC125231124 [Leguminivora glycinivorella]
MSKIKAKRYCIAAECKNNDRDRNISFFLIPTGQRNFERRQKWLTLLGREDLLDKDLHCKSYYVCCSHFDDSSVKIVKQLKDTAIPSLCLPKKRKANAKKQTSKKEEQPISTPCKDIETSSSKSSEVMTETTATFFKPIQVKEEEDECSGGNMASTEILSNYLQIKIEVDESSDGKIAMQQLTESVQIKKENDEEWKETTSSSKGNMESTAILSEFVEIKVEKDDEY